MAVLDHRPGHHRARFVNEKFLEVVESNLTLLPDKGMYHQIRAVRDGKLVHWTDVTLPTGGIPMTRTSGDGRWLAVCFSPTSGRLPGSPATLQFIEVGRGKVVYQCDAVWLAPNFQPNSSRYIVPEAATRRLALYEPQHARPLAVLAGADASRAVPQSQFSPDGQTILIQAGARGAFLDVYRRAGWDCRESHLGAIVFPQTWVAACAWVATMLVLIRDAGRGGRAAADSVRALASVLLVVALPVAVYAVFRACLGGGRDALWLSPAAVMVGVAIGLALGSRFWRVMGLWMSAAGLPYLLWLAYRVWGAGPKESTLYPLLDRHYQVPHLPMLIGLLCAAVLLAMALVVLARSTRQSAAA